MNEQVIGTCSECGGAVTVPALWLGIYPPVPTCRKCGAVAKQSYGPVILMRPPQRTIRPAGRTWPRWEDLPVQEEPYQDGYKRRCRGNQRPTTDDRERYAEEISRTNR